MKQWPYIKPSRARANSGIGETMALIDSKTLQFGAFLDADCWPNTVPLLADYSIVDCKHHPRKRLIRLNEYIIYAGPDFDEHKFPCISPLKNYRQKDFDEWAENYSLFVAKPGTLSNGASVPRPFWAICDPFHPRVLPAAVLHDLYYYRINHRICDDLFYNAMKCSEYWAFGALRNYKVVSWYRPFRPLLQKLRIVKSGELEW